MGEKKLSEKFSEIENATPSEQSAEIKLIKPIEVPKNSQDKKEGIQHELERLIEILKSSETKTIALVKDLAQSENNRDIITLKTILHSLDNAHLRKISSFLSQAEKITLSHPKYTLPSEDEIKKGTLFLEAKLNELNLIDPKINNQQALNKLLSFTIEEIREFVEVHPGIGEKSLFLFPSEKVAKILEGYNEESLERILNSVSELKSDEEIQKLEQTILAHNSTVNANSSFLKNFPAIVKELSISREKLILEQFKYMNLSQNHLKIIAKAKPMSLMAEMEPEFFTKIGEGLSLENKVRIILSTTQNFISNIKDGFFPRGTQVFDMFKMEEANLENNQASLAQLKRNEQIIWKDFAGICRDVIEDSEIYQDQLYQVILQWSGALDSSDDEEDL